MALDAAAAYQRDLYQAASHLAQLVGDVSSLRKTTWLVTGGTGQIGAACVDLLHALSQTESLKLNIVVAAHNERRFTQRFSDNVRRHLAFRPYEAAEGLDVSGVDFIIHAAGYGDPQSMVKDPVGILQVNINGLGLILQSLEKRNSTRLVYISSGESYGFCESDPQGLREDQSGYVNTMETRSCYPTAKRAGESLCRSYFSQFGVKAIVARQCHVFGPGFSKGDTRVAALFAKAAVEGKSIVMKSAGTQIRSWCYELDAASALIFLAFCGSPGEAYNIAPQETASIAELASAFAKAGKVEVSFENPNEAEAARFSKISRAVLSNNKLSKLGWTQAFIFADAIAGTISSLKNASLR
jgi:nucleoside-diphosphate-sugar epimerase